MRRIPAYASGCDDQTTCDQGGAVQLITCRKILTERYLSQTAYGVASVPDASSVRDALLQLGDYQGVAGHLAKRQ